MDISRKGDDALSSPRKENGNGPNSGEKRKKENEDALQSISEENEKSGHMAGFLKKIADKVRKKKKKTDDEGDETDSSSNASTPTKKQGKTRDSFGSPLSPSMMTIESFVQKEKQERDAQKMVDANGSDESTEETKEKVKRKKKKKKVKIKEEEEEEEEEAKDDDDSSSLSESGWMKKGDKKILTSEDGVKARWNPKGSAYNVRTWELVDKIRALRGERKPTGKIGLLSNTTVKRLQRELLIASIVFLFLKCLFFFSGLFVSFPSPFSPFPCPLPFLLDVVVFVLVLTACC